MFVPLVKRLYLCDDRVKGRENGGWQFFNLSYTLGSRACENWLENKTTPILGTKQKTLKQNKTFINTWFCEYWMHLNSNSTPNTFII